MAKYSIVECGIVEYNIVGYGMVEYSTIVCSVVEYSILGYGLVGPHRICMVKCNKI